MFRHLSENMKKMLIEELCKKYDNINRKLQDDLVKIWYEPFQIQEMKDQLKRIDEIIQELNKE